MLTRKLLALVFPEGLLFLAAAALVHWGSGAPAAGPVLRFLPIAVIVAGALLGWRFQRGRLLLGLAGLVIAERAFAWLAPLESDAPFAGPVVVRAVAILLPLSLCVLAFLSERGVLSVPGLRRIAVLAGEVAVLLLVWLLSAVFPAGMTAAFDVPLLPPPMLSGIPIGQPAALVAFIAIVVLVARIMWAPSAESRGLLWATIGTVIAATVGPANGRATLYFACAGFVLVVAMVESAYAMAYHDELTSLPARRALNDALQRVAGTYTVAMVDVDHFKKFNDTHGHDVGDQVLRMVAGRLARVTGGGRAYRYGGEEFAVLFPGKSATEIAPHLELLRESVADAKFLVRGKDRPKRKPKAPRARGEAAGQLAVTVSIGAAQARGALLPDEVVKAADKALYRAKEGGRNRVAI